jgi:beta-lactamase regulating signal transducer with metallopeptidase domain
MAAFASGLETFCLWLARASWHGSILIGLVLALQWALRRVVAPHHLYSLWLLVLVRLALPFSIETSFSIFNTDWTKTPGPIARQNRPEVVTYRVLDNAEPAKSREALILPSATWVESRETEKPWMAFLPLVWLIGSLALVAHVAWRNHRLSDRVRRAPPVTDSAVLGLIQRCRQSAGVRQPLWVIETADVKSPALFGLLVPRLLLPAGLIDRFTAAELRFIFLHELTHVRRLDIALNWLVTGLLVLHWFNPIVWFAFKRLRSDRELVRDANVLRHLAPEEAPAYGETILKLMEGFVPQSPSPGLIGILETNSQLRRRLSMIADFKNPVPLRPWLASVAALVLAFVTLTDARVDTRLPVVPEVAQTAREITVRVVDAETGRGIPGATVGPQHATDAQGSAVVLLPATLDVRAEGYVSRTFKLLKPDFVDRLIVQLDRADTIGGVVLDREGKAIRDVEVHVVGATPGITPRRSRVAKTDIQGRWIWTGLSRKVDSILLQLTHPEYVEAFYVTGSSPLPGSPLGAQVLSIEELKARRPALVMDRGLTISGRVLDRHGRPVEGAEVSHGGGHGTPAGKTVTAGDGHFHFANGRLGTNNLTVQREGFVTATERVLVMPRATPFSFHLVRGRVIRGRVVDQEGRAVSGAMVSAVGASRWFGETGKDGSFVWTSAPAGPVRVRVDDPGYASVPGFLTLEPGDREYEIQLNKIKEIKINGIVFDAVTKAPIPEFSVLLASSHFQAGRTNYRPAATGKNGVFTLVLREPFFPYGIKVEADGYRPDASHSISREGEGRLEIGLFRGSGPSGKVVTSDGRAVWGAAVVLVAGRLPAVLHDSGEVDSSPDESERFETDAMGQFFLKPVADARTLLVSHKLGFALVRVDEVRAPPVIVLEPWGRLQGRLRIGPRPASNETVSLANAKLDLPAYRLALDRFTRTDTDGNFRFERIPPGHYDVAFIQKIDKPGEGPGSLSFTQHTIDKARKTQVLPVRVAAGQTTTVQLGGRGRPLTGKIVFVGRKERIEWNSFYHRLETLFSSSGFVSFAVAFGPWGSYRVDDVPSGRYRLTLRIPQLPEPVVREVEVPEIPGGRSDLPLSLGTITIR